MDDEDLAQEVVKGFLSDIPRQLKRLHTYLASGDLSGVARQAHTIKGAAGNVSAEALRGVALQMEKAIQSGDIVAVCESTRQMEEEFSLLLQTINTVFLPMQPNAGQHENSHADLDS
jgi:HPt (histidine-containing phosphotransfer) domain-containing protein